LSVSDGWNTAASPKGLSNQQKAIDRQISNQEILIKARKWTRILLALLVVAAFLYLLQPLAFLFWARSR